MNESLARERLITFVSRRILVSPEVVPAFLGQQLPTTVGFRSPGGGSDWFTDAEALGEAVANDAGFQAIQLGTWLNSPNGVLIAEAVGQVLPPEYRPEYQLVLSALQFAASRQYQAGWQRAAGIGVLIGAGADVLWLARSG